MSDIYLQITETPTVVTLSAPVISGALSSTVTVANVVTVALDSNSLSALENVTVTVGAAVTISNFPATQAISGTVTANGGNFSAENATFRPNKAIQIGYWDAWSSGDFVFVNNEDQQFPVKVYGDNPAGSYSIPVEIDGNSIGQKLIPIGYNASGDARQVSDGSPLPIQAPDGITITNTVSANLAFAIPTGTNRIGVVTIGGGTVTIGAGTAQIGSVTASISGTVPVSLASTTVTVSSLPALAAGTAQIGSVTASISGTVPISISSVTVGNSVTIGSIPAISGTVTANIAISSSAITSGSFTSLTSATLVPANTARKMATVYNLGAGQLFVNAGASATTLGGGFMVALSSGDFYECDYTTTTLSAIFATAGTASWVSH